MIISKSNMAKIASTIAASPGSDVYDISVVADGDSSFATTSFVTTASLKSKYIPAELIILSLFVKLDRGFIRYSK